MQRMIEDIDFAIRYLPTKHDLYRITKWTALALKSRFCLFEGTFRKYHDIDLPENDWKYYLSLSAKASEEFITNSGYGLYIGRHADRLPRPVRVGRRPADRGRPRPRLQQGAKRIPQQHLLLAEHLLRPSGADAQDRRQLSDGRRHAFHGQGGLGNDGVPGRVPEPRSASGAIDPHAGLHAHQLHQGRSAEPVDLA